MNPWADQGVIVAGGVSSHRSGVDAAISLRPQYPAG
jgi:hypothetical protein